MKQMPSVRSLRLEDDHAGSVRRLHHLPPVAGVSQHANRANATISSGRLHAGNCRRDVGSERANGRE